MVRFKNVSQVALPIPELNNLIVPKGGYTPPLPDATPTLNAYIGGRLFLQESVDVPALSGATVQAVTQGDVNANDNAGKVAPLVAGPGQTVAKVDYTPLKVSTAAEKLKNYDNSAEVKKALANTVISVGSEQNPINLFGEIPADEAVRLIKAQGNGSFSTEVSGGEYIADEAQKIIASAAGITARPPNRLIPMPEGLPADLVPFFQSTGLQKKIFIYKTPNWEMLHQIQGFEKDANVLSCITQRLNELGK
jgi:hypothetical protein